MITAPYYQLSRGRIPAVGLGLWQVKDKETFNLSIKSALDSGYTHFDTAQAYGNESMLGDTIQELNVKRDNLFITTKVSVTNLCKSRTTSSIDKSLKDLKTDYVDLLLIHFPVTFLRRSAWRVLEDTYENGKARDIGVSNYTIRHLEEMKKYTSIRPSVNQVELHVFLQQPELVDYCKKEGIIIEAYSPIAHGKNMDDPTILSVAKKYNKSYVQIMLKWCLQKGLVIIPKSVTPDRIRQNIELFDFELDNDDMIKISKLDSNMRTCWSPVNIP
jgi:diketogulonate reductase-like aldo/keto reductase